VSIILIVDDDNNFLLSLVEGLKSHDKEFEIKTAENGKIATQILSDEYVDLIITDLKMPVMDGFELLAYMSSHYPRIPVIVMTAYGTPVIENSVSNLGAIRYIEKPLDFDLLVENIYKSIQPYENGYVPGIPLISFMKLIQMERKTCFLTIRAQNQEGKMFFKKGSLINAISAQKSGEAAAIEIMGWEQPEIHISSKSFSIEKSIDNDMDFLNMVVQSRHRNGQGKSSSQSSAVSSYDTELGGIFNLDGEEGAPKLSTEPPKGKAEENIPAMNYDGEDSCSLCEDLLGGKETDKSTINAEPENNAVSISPDTDILPSPEGLDRNTSSDTIIEEASKNDGFVSTDQDDTKDSFTEGESIGDIEGQNLEVTPICILEEDNIIPTEQAGADIGTPVEASLEGESGYDEFLDAVQVGVKHGLSEGEPVFDTDEDSTRDMVSGEVNKLLSVSETEQEKTTNFGTGKENAVNVRKMNEALNTLKETAGAGLLSCDIYTTRDGQSIISYNGNETYCAMSNQITQYMINTIKEAGFPPMGNTYMVDLADDKMVIVLIMGDYQWGILIDTKKTSLGILLNVALPKAKTVFAAALEN
jgi:CheY-like chemotaxis protein